MNKNKILSPQQQKIVDELQNNKLTAWVDKDGKIELVSFRRFAGFMPHLSAVRSLVKKQLIECYDEQIRPGYVYDIWCYRLVKLARE